jgi:cytochrome bd-type quinol oxidase subunit 2
MKIGERTTAPGGASDAGRYHGTRTTVASIAAISSILAASSCCLPILPFIAAAGFAGSSAFLSAARPYLLGASILFIAYGFYQASRERKCQRRPSVIGSVLLWVSTVFVVISILFPQVMANAAASMLGR